MEKEKCDLCGGDGIIEEYGDGENFEYDVIAEHPCPNGCKRVDQKYSKDTTTAKVFFDGVKNEAQNLFATEKAILNKIKKQK